MKLKYLYLYSISSFIFSHQAQAQKWEIGLNGGAASYLGDLNPINPAKVSGLNLGTFVRYNVDPFWNFGVYYNFGTIAAADSKSKYPYYVKRNLSFETGLHEISGQIGLNFFNYLNALERKRITPFLQVGGGVVGFNPKAKYQGQLYELRNLMLEEQEHPYKPYALVLIYGAGVKFEMNERWSFFSQVTARNVYSDYLDDVSGVYPDVAKFPTDALGKLRAYFSNRSSPGNPPGTMRGDARKNDYYFFAGIGITYTFVSSKCY